MEITNGEISAKYKMFMLLEHRLSWWKWGWWGLRVVSLASYSNEQTQ